MNAELVGLTQNRFKHIDQSLAETAQVIKRTKLMLNQASSHQLHCSKSFKIQNISSSALQFNVSCRISVEDFRSQYSSGKGQIDRHPKQIVTHHSEVIGNPNPEQIKKSFSFGRLATPQIGAQAKNECVKEEEVEPENLFPQKHQQPDIISQRKYANYETIKTPSTTLESRASEYFKKLANEADGRMNLVETEEQGFHTPQKRYKTQTIKIEDSFDDYVDTPVKKQQSIQQYSNLSTQSNNKFRHKIAHSPVKTVKYKTYDQKFQFLKERLKSELSKSKQVRKSTQSALKYSSSKSPNKGNHTIIIRDISPIKKRLLEYQYSSNQRLRSPSNQLLNSRPGIVCPKYKRQVERQIRSQFLRQFGFLYTEKRLTYQELFELYRGCRSKNIPQYRWPEEVSVQLGKRQRLKTSKI